MERPAISSARICMAASRSTGAGAAPSRTSASSVALATWRRSNGTTRGATAGAMVWRWNRQASPSLRNKPWPTSGRRMRMVAGERR